MHDNLEQELRNRLCSHIIKKVCTAWKSHIYKANATFDGFYMTLALSRNINYDKHVCMRVVAAMRGPGIGPWVRCLDSKYAIEIPLEKVLEESASGLAARLPDSLVLQYAYNHRRIMHLTKEEYLRVKALLTLEAI